MKDLRAKGFLSGEGGYLNEQPESSDPFDMLVKPYGWSPALEVRNHKLSQTLFDIFAEVPSVFKRFVLLLSARPPRM